MTPRTSVVVGALAFFLVGFAATPAFAVPITFAFTGLVSQEPLLDPDDPFGGSIAVDTPFSGTFVFESTTADGDASANGGSYTSTGGVLSVTIGGQVFTASDLLNIGVGNDFAGSDFYTVFAQLSSGPDPFDVSLFLQDDDGTALNSALLPTDAPPFASFEVATLFLSGTVQGNQVQIQGDLASLTCIDGCIPLVPVPEPSTLTLLGASLACLCRRRRRRPSR
jgi:hypothetical protein